MKLLKNQYQDILNTFQEFEIGADNFSLLKKKGRIKIILADKNSNFEFFRRKSVSLSADDHRWKSHEHYQLVIDGQSMIVASWMDVIQQLKRWIKQ